VFRAVLAVVVVVVLCLVLVVLELLGKVLLAALPMQPPLEVAAAVREQLVEQQQAPLPQEMVEMGFSHLSLEVQFTVVVEVAVGGT
jgi:hypothetical protein